MSFEEWISELRRLQIEEFGFPPGKPESFYGDAESWKLYFDDGYEPYDALAEDLICV